MKQMSDGVDVMKNVPRAPGVNYPVLVPNLKGYDTAVRSCYVLYYRHLSTVQRISKDLYNFSSLLVIFSIHYLFTFPAKVRKVFGFTKDQPDTPVINS